MAQVETGRAAHAGHAEPSPPARPGRTGLGLERDDANDSRSTPLAHDILVFPTDHTLETLHARWRKSDIIVPSLERGYTWGRPQASKLIESFMIGLPVPPVYLSTIDEETSVVLDGHQRLLTIFSYFEGTLPRGSPHGGQEFRIEGINRGSALYGRTFDELDYDGRARLKNSLLRVMTIVHNNPEDGLSMYEISERLNAGGTPLAAQEARSCAYHGPLSDLLGDLNSMGEWRSHAKKFLQSLKWCRLITPIQNMFHPA